MATAAAATLSATESEPHGHFKSIDSTATQFGLFDRLDDEERISGSPTNLWNARVCLRQLQMSLDLSANLIRTITSGDCASRSGDGSGTNGVGAESGALASGDHASGLRALQANADPTVAHALNDLHAQLLCATTSIDFPAFEDEPSADGDGAPRGEAGRARAASELPWAIWQLEHLNRRVASAQLKKAEQSAALERCELQLARMFGARARLLLLSRTYRAWRQATTVGVLQREVEAERGSRLDAISALHVERRARATAEAEAVSLRVAMTHALARLELPPTWQPVHRLPPAPHGPPPAQHGANSKHGADDAASVTAAVGGSAQSMVNDHAAWQTPASAPPPSQLTPVPSTGLVPAAVMSLLPVPTLPAGASSAPRLHGMPAWRKPAAAVQQLASATSWDTMEAHSTTADRSTAAAAVAADGSAVIARAAARIVPNAVTPAPPSASRVQRRQLRLSD